MGAVRSIVLEADPLTADAWAPFGWLPVADTDPLDQTFSYEFAWGDPHVNVISHAFDEVPHTDRGALCEIMYRHDTHTQTLLPLNVDSVVAVAPAAVDFADPADLDAVRVFRIHPLDPFALFRGTWHWGPFPIGAEAVRMFNVQGKRYAEDNASVDLAAKAGAVFEVLT
ncbi:MAG TPA: ureidoglycolate lyase [Acidimicrobiia bacterium]